MQSIVKIMDGLKNHRKKPRFLSVKIIRKSHLFDNLQPISNQLQQALDKQIINDNPQISQPIQITQNQQKQIQDNILWKKFQQKITFIGNKVQKIKLNLCKNIMQSIKAQADDKIDRLTENINAIKLFIQKKYKETHSLYQEIQRQKQSNSNKGNKTIVEGVNSSFIKEKINLLLQNISEIVREINKNDQQLKKQTQKLNKLKNQRLNFIKKLLKQGYYTHNGMNWQIEQLLNLGYNLTIQDMPYILDNISKQCLLKEANNIQHRNKKIQPQFPKINRTNRKYTYLNSNHNKLLQNKSQLRELYQDAKRYVEQKIRNKDWSESYSPPSYLNTSRTIYRWKDQENRRIKSIYNNQSQQKILKILFGLKLQYDNL